MAWPGQRKAAAFGLRCGEMTDALDELAHAVRHGTAGVVALTGSGISVASGVPSFRGTSGLWQRYDPAEYATISAIREHPKKVWQFLRELDDVLRAAEPNPAHHAIAELGRRGFVSHVITQNVDGLHQAAGSERVIELHGTNATLSCLSCGRRYVRAELGDVPRDVVPRCRDCGGVLKPDVTFFGEQLPNGALNRAEHAVRRASVLLVIGTSAEIQPASRLPTMAGQAGGQVWEINPDPALPSPHGVVAQPAEVALPELVRRLRPPRTWRRIIGTLKGLNVARWFE